MLHADLTLANLYWKQTHTFFVTFDSNLQNMYTNRYLYTDFKTLKGLKTVA